MKPKRNPEVNWRLEKGLYENAREEAKRGGDYEDIGVLTLMAGNSIHQLNLVGAEIWLRINGIAAVDTIVKEIAEIFEVDSEEMKGDVVEFLNSIRERGWITIE
ncbi:MAG: PqqD family peptide modification chaperone [Deltaproteobacteria bacterium]|nr:PqqD family peptide modification chaperone [Deltaproteobacteria bacterium]NIS77935.1 PqqD family peptide modification chaperone [Deltaproteobacteria bacterium]